MSYPTLDEWAHSGVITITLPAAGDQPSYTVDFKIPDLSAFIAAGKIPNPLLGLALRIEQEGVAEDALTAEEVKDYFELQCIIVARNLVRPNLVEEMGEPAAIEWVRSTMPPLHRRKIWEAAMHLDISEAVKGLLELARFRDEPSSAELPDGGAANGESAVAGGGDPLQPVRSRFRRGPRGA